MAEQEHPEAHLPLQERHAHTEAVFGAISAQPDYQTGHIGYGESRAIGFDGQPLAYEDYGGRGMDQTLQAVIKSRYHVFGVVRLRGGELEEDALVVTRFSENPHWSRTETAEPLLDQETAIHAKGRSLFSLRYDADGLTVTPLTEHGIEMTVAKPAETAPAEVQSAGNFGLKAAWKNLGRRKRPAHVSPANPLTADPNTWLAHLSTYDTVHDLQEARKEPPPSELFQSLERECTPQARADAKAALEKEIAEDSEVQAVRELLREQDELYKVYEHSLEKAAISFDIQRIQAEIWEDHREGAVRNQELSGRLRMLELEVTTIDRGDSRLDFLEQTDQLDQPRAVIVAAGQHIVPKQDAIDKLKTLPFIPVWQTDSWRLKHGRDAGIRAVASRQEPFQIPIDLVVSAEGFESWAGRGPNGGERKDTHPTSIDAIIDYASRESDIPPVDHMSCYVQPDGQRYFISQNAHRTAAFKARGVSHVPASSVDIRLLSHNVYTNKEGEH